MNRSVVREFQAPGISVEPGAVLVPTEIGDPVRGALSCPAAPLIGGTLQRKGRRVSYAPVPRCDDPSHDSDGAALFVVTCQQPDGTTVALAAAASPADRLAVGAARSAVEEWSAVLGTRRLITAASPWCDGARRALELTRRATQAGSHAVRHRAVHIYGEPAGSAQAGAELSGVGAVFSASLPDIPDGDAVVFPAHGVTPEVRAQAAARGLEVIDATCPLVAAAQAEAARLASRGDHLVLIGQPGHPAATAIAAHAATAPGKTTVIGSVTGMAAVQVADARRVSYLLQPGIPIEDTSPVAAALRSRYPAVRGPHPDGFCYAASDRADSIRTVSARCDLVLVLGTADSADARQLIGLIRDCDARAQVIAEVGDITPAMLAGTATIGMTESHSASLKLASQVTAALSGLGSLSVVRRQVSTAVNGQPLAAAPAGA
jgi:4-hydroxy-3-methylbut-2-enyl diphosphate reductase